MAQRRAYSQICPAFDGCRNGTIHSKYMNKSVKNDKITVTRQQWEENSEIGPVAGFHCWKKLRIKTRLVKLYLSGDKK